MNWGYKIILVYAVFVAGMLFLAFKSTKQNIELVTEDYYAKELVFQQKIDESKHTASLSSPVEIKQVDSELIIHFPKDFAAKKLTGDYTLYCPSNEKKDIQQPFVIIDSNLVIKVPAGYHGLHYVKISWSVEAVNYYFEQRIII